MYNNGIIIKHSPSADFGKFTLIVDGKVLSITNSINPSELLDTLGIPHTYKIEVK